MPVPVSRLDCNPVYVDRFRQDFYNYTRVSQCLHKLLFTKAIMFYILDLLSRLNNTESSISLDVSDSHRVS